MKTRTMIVSIISIIILLLIILVVMNFTGNAGKQQDKSDEAISEEKILEYANNTFEYTEIPEENKEEYIQEFTETYKEEIKKEDEEIEKEIEKIEEEEDIEESDKTNKADKVAQIVSRAVESKLLIKIEESNKAEIPNDGFEYTEDGQVGVNAGGYDGLPAEENEIEAIQEDEAKSNGAQNDNNKSNINISNGRIELEVPKDMVKEPENIIEIPKGDE